MISVKNNNNIISTFDYNDKGLFYRQQNLNNTNTILNYNEYNKLSSLNHYYSNPSQPAVSFYERGYVYDDAGNLIKKQKRSVDGETWVDNTIYSYDYRYRMTEENWVADDYTIEYIYDGNNNIIQRRKTGPGWQGTWENYVYPDTSNRLLQVGQTYFTYDENGNIVRKMKNDYVEKISYDYRNLPDTISVSYNENQYDSLFLGYDGKNRRYKKVVKSWDGETIRYSYNYAVYDGTNLMEEYDRDGNCVAQYIYLGLVRIAMIKDDQLYFFHFDRLGSVVAVTDEDGEVVWQGDYFAYGTMKQQSGTDNPWRFTGHRWDEESGLYHFLARYLDAEYEHFTTMDPVRSDFSSYNYTYGNPVNYIDYTGAWGTKGLFVLPYIFPPTNILGSQSDFVSYIGNRGKMISNSVLNIYLYNANPYYFQAGFQYPRNYFLLDGGNPYGISGALLTRIPILGVIIHEEWHQKTYVVYYKFADYPVLLEGLLTVGWYEYSYEYYEIYNFPDFKTTLSESGLGFLLNRPVGGNNTLSNAGMLTSTMGGSLGIIRAGFEYGREAKEVAKSLKYVRGIGTVVNVVGIIITAYEIKDNPEEILGEKGLDLIMGVIGFQFPYGTIISVSYFVFAKPIYQSYMNR